MIAIWIGFIADLIFGDPYWLPHPVRFIGLMIEKTERILRSFAHGERALRAAGLLLVLIVTGTSFLVPYFLLKGAWALHPLVALALEAAMVYQILATRCLDVETAKVRKLLEAGNLPGAREAIAMLVSRDTDVMDDQDIGKAAIETMMENIVDGVVSPLFYLFLGGVPLGFAYKAINTMDSMVGYKNEKYLDFGRAAALIDDAVNYVPARLTALLVVWMSALLGLDSTNAWRMLKRDRRNHASPNSAYAEAPAAGALRVQLGGKASYFGEVSMKPTMGEPLESVSPEHIRKASYLLYGTAAAGLLLFTVVCWLIW